MKTKLIILSIALCLSAAPAMAVPFGDGGAALQGVLDGIATDGTNDVKAATDELPDSGDSLWSIGGSGGSISTLIIELAAFADDNTFGLYDATNPAKKVQIFAGAAGPGAQTLVSILGDGSVLVNFGDTGIDFAANSFGFYLGSPGAIQQVPVDTVAAVVPAAGFWYSNTLLNWDGMDHMAAYQGIGEEIEIPPFAAGPWGANEYILAWEDLPVSGDRDFTDFVVLVESVSPVPVPGAVLLGILGLSAAGIKLRRFA